MLPMFQRGIKLTIIFSGLWMAWSAQNLFAQNGLIPVATNVWAAPNRTLNRGRDSVRNSWKKNPPLPVKTHGFIPLKPKAQAGVTNLGQVPAHPVFTGRAARRPVLGIKPANGAVPTPALGPRTQHFNSLNRGNGP